MKPQKIWWSSNVISYKDEIAWKQKDDGTVPFVDGKKALAFLNSADNAPWIQKDPRMCITLKTWLKYLNSKPAVIFTYRHPLEVAMSLNRREKGISIEHGLRLWIVYNRRALENSVDLCRVYTSNDAIMLDSLAELNRISRTLTDKCGVPKPPKELTQEAIDLFIDPKLHHNRKKDEEGKAVIVEEKGCRIVEYDSTLPKDSTSYKRERSLYLKAMKVFCDLGAGKPYAEGYEWPSLV